MFKTTAEDYMLEGEIVTQEMVYALSNQTPPNNSRIDVETPTELTVPLLYFLAFNQLRISKYHDIVIASFCHNVTYIVEILDVLTTLTN